MNIVRELRKKKGVQQKEIALIAGVAQPTVSEWELGKKDPSGDRLKKLSEYFGVDELVILGKGVVDLNTPESARAAPYPDEDRVVQRVLDRLNMVDERQNMPIESQLIVKAVNKMPQEDREKVLNMMRAVYSEYFDNEEDKIG